MLIVVSSSSNNDDDVFVVHLRKPCYDFCPVQATAIKAVSTKEFPPRKGNKCSSRPRSRRIFKELPISFDNGYSTLIPPSLARYRNKPDKSLHQLRTAMHHQPPNHERALNLSILTVSGPALQPYFPGTEKLSFPGSCPSRRIYRRRNASWYRLRSELGRYLIAFEPLTFVLD
ncbi:putative rRNA intron-encoded homing endonuclease [Dirofilaria immitis]|nr:putative rRNA intron-encoded homing endonuclease [Dirofilaria immitis]